MSGIGDFLGGLGGPLSGALGGAINPMSGLGMIGNPMSGLGLLLKLLGGGSKDEGAQTNPGAPVAPVPTSVPPGPINFSSGINDAMTQNTAMGQNGGSGMNAARYALSSDGMSGLGAGLGHLLSRIGMRL